MINLSELKTGDIVLFSGRCWVAWLIKIITGCKWSHVGMIVIDPDYGEPLVYEATHNDRVPGIDLGEKNQGVQLVRLKDRLEGYQGDIAVMKVSCSSLDLESFDKFRKNSVGVKFETNFLEMFLSHFKWIGNKGNFEERFCSEHVGGAYKALGLLHKGYDVHKVTPADFAKKKIVLKSAILGDLIEIKNFKRGKIYIGNEA